MKSGVKNGTGDNPGFISSHLDYCYSLLTCLNKKELDCVLAVKNSAARLLTRASKREHTVFSLTSLVTSSISNSF